MPATTCAESAADLARLPGRAIMVDLGDFDPARRGQCLTGRLEGKALRPYAEVKTPSGPPAKPAPSLRVTWTASDFANLDGWRDDRLGEAAAAFARTCPAIMRKPPGTAFGAFGRVEAWQQACAAARRAGPMDDAAAREFFTTRFRPWLVAGNGDAQGLFTGYFEPVLQGSRQRSGAYATPLRALPDDMVTIRPADFGAGLPGRRLTGRIDGRWLKPYPDRRAIEAGGLAAGQDRPLVWVNDKVAAFFLQIQGSGVVRLADGSTMRMGYAGQNGRPYTAIGGEIVRRGGLTLDQVSAQSIARWLHEHPDQTDAVMDTDASYVFFKPLPSPVGEGPPGAAGVPLTPRRSLAVDHALLPYGVPVWVDAAPAPGGTLRRLMIAQDTGGAIKGAVRGDVFWGRGDAAGQAAGSMKAHGRMYLLLPNGVTPSGAASP